MLPDGSVYCYLTDPRYSLSSALPGLAAGASGSTAPDAAWEWLVCRALDRGDGGVRDTASPFSEKFSNVAGFAVMSLLGFPPFP